MLGNVLKGWHERRRRRLRGHRGVIREKAKSVRYGVRRGAHVQRIHRKRRCAEGGGAGAQEQRRGGRDVRNVRGPNRRAQDRPRVGHGQTSNVRD